jgi:tetratricopeptide (TPR) repeat protein
MLQHPVWRTETPSSLECLARKALARKSDFYWAHYQYAECVGRGEQGETYDGTHAQVGALTRATKLKPDWALAYNDMGLRFGYWQHRGNLQASVKHLSHAVALDPSSGIYFTNLAMAYQHMGQLVKAANFSRRAATLQPDNAQVQVQLGRGMSLRNDASVSILPNRACLITELWHEHPSSAGGHRRLQGGIDGLRGSRAA